MSFSSLSPRSASPPCGSVPKTTPDRSPGVRRWAAGRAGHRCSQRHGRWPRSQPSFETAGQAVCDPKARRKSPAKAGLFFGLCRSYLSRPRGAVPPCGPNRGVEGADEAGVLAWVMGGVGKREERKACPGWARCGCGGWTTRTISAGAWSWPCPFVVMPPKRRTSSSRLRGRSGRRGGVHSLEDRWLLSWSRGGVLIGCPPRPRIWVLAVVS